MKVKSISDVISNSSNETFAKLGVNNFSSLKEIFDTILKIGRETKDIDFDEIFELDYDRNYGMHDDEIKIKALDSSYTETAKKLENAFNTLFEAEFHEDEFCG